MLRTVKRFKVWDVCCGGCWRGWWKRYRLSCRFTWTPKTVENHWVVLVDEKSLTGAGVCCHHVNLQELELGQSMATINTCEWTTDSRQG